MQEDHRGEAGLAGLNLQTSYHKGTSDIGRDFFLPAMATATTYRRAVAYFRSSIFAIAWPSVRQFVRNDGQMKIICSPQLTESDKKAAEEGYTARQDADLAKQLRQEIDRMLNTEGLRKPTRILGWLIAENYLDIKLAYVGPDASGVGPRMFHEKVGIFSDAYSNTVVFKGSMNESWSALSEDGNLESIDVFVSWGSRRERERVREENTHFQELWKGDYPEVTTRSVPEAARKKLIDARPRSGWERILTEIEEAFKEERAIAGGDESDGRSKVDVVDKEPYQHQAEVLDSWFEQDRRGIVAHATGSGKTVTAMFAIADAINRNELPVVIVPSQVLLRQWDAEFTSSLPSVRILRCGAGNDRWKRGALLRRFSQKDQDASPKAILTTIQTAAGSEFRNAIASGNHKFLVVDEVHTSGSPKHSNIFNIESGPRLGLSATPKRYNDPEGTRAIKDYFGPILEPRFSISDAIRKNRLCSYSYNPRRVHLTPDEKEEWQTYTEEIGRRVAMQSDGERSEPMEDDKIQRLLIKRADVAKTASRKVALAGKVLQEEYRDGDRWIVYCANQDQMGAVESHLKEEGFEPLTYHYEMEADREETLKYFERRGGVILAIKCLDEGVDIPNATHALILSSSRNPREFIQRRGRVLRRHPKKERAYLYDAIVVPEEDGATGVDSLIEAELARAILFGEDAENARAVAKLKDIALDMGIEPDAVAPVGVEHEDR